jgi:hypothetical protein
MKDITDDPPNPRCRVSVPPRAHPHVRLAFAEMRRQMRTMDWISEKSGVQRPCLKAWRHRNRPGLDGLTAVLNCLGIEYLPVVMPKALPPDIARDLADLAQRMNAEMPETMAALIAIAGKQQARIAKAEAA